MFIWDAASLTGFINNTHVDVMNWLLVRLVHIFCIVIHKKISSQSLIFLYKLACVSILKLQLERIWLFFCLLFCKSPTCPWKKEKWTVRYSLQMEKIIINVFFNNWLIIYVSTVGTLKANIQKKLMGWDFISNWKFKKKMHAWWGGKVVISHCSWTLLSPACAILDLLDQASTLCGLCLFFSSFFFLLGRCFVREKMHSPWSKTENAVKQNWRKRGTF